MAKHHCDNANGYSSGPVPFVGLYIAGASLVCLLLMLWDIFFAIRRKTRHIPCLRFSLNSVTITLLVIVSKLPVDLTTNMPSARDQLSKLTGMAMTCVCIGFMAPSLGSSKESESIANMAALSIFIVTLVVNICIQLGTGVIFSFVAEHIIIMCCMFTLLAILWSNTLGFNSGKAPLSKKNLAHFLTIPKGKPSLIHRTKSWYMSCSIYNPQLLLCRATFSIEIGPICLMCLLVLLQATYRSIVARSLEFCGGVSDYKWSMWIIVITQIVAATIGALTSAFRWIAMLGHWDIFHSVGIGDELRYLKLQFSLMKRRSMRTSIMVLSKFTVKSVLFVIIVCIHAPIFAIVVIVFMILGVEGEQRCCAHKAREDIASTLDSWRDEFDMELDGLAARVMMVCVNNMNNWLNVKRDPPPCHHMVQMLSKLHCSTTPKLLNSFVAIGNNDYSRYKMSSLSMVVLAKVVAPLFPSSVRTKSMTDTLREAFEIVYYIDKKMNVETYDSRKQQFAKLLWEGGEVDIRKMVLFKNEDNPVECTLSNVKRANETLITIIPEYELRVVGDFIKDQKYETIKDLYDCVEQLFSEMLHHFLAQLPICVFKEVHDGSIEDCEERARFLTKLLCELDSSLENKVEWKFPDGWPAYTSRIFDLPQDSNDTNAQNDTSTVQRQGSNEDDKARFSLFTDAERDPMTGDCGIGWVLYNDRNTPMLAASISAGPSPSVAVGEGWAILGAVKDCVTMCDNLTIFSHAQTVIEGLKNYMLSDSSLEPIYRAIRRLTEGKGSIEYACATGSRNPVAHNLARRALESHSSCTWSEPIPTNEIPLLATAHNVPTTTHEIANAHGDATEDGGGRASATAQNVPIEQVITVRPTDDVADASNNV